MDLLILTHIYIHIMYNLHIILYFLVANTCNCNCCYKVFLIGRRSFQLYVYDRHQLLANTEATAAVQLDYPLLYRDYELWHQFWL